MAFFQDLREKFSAAADQVSAATAGLDGKTQVEQLLVLRRQDKVIDQAMGYYALLQGELTDTDRSKAEFLASVRNRSMLSTQHLVLEVRAAREHQDVADVVTKFLTDHNVKTGADTVSANGVVEVAVKSRLENVQGNMLVRLDVSLQVRDERQQTVSGQNYVASGVSLSSHVSARQQAVMKLQEELRKAGLIGGLGFNTQ
jgi:hypothetical protein